MMKQLTLRLAKIRDNILQLMEEYRHRLGEHSWQENKPYYTEALRSLFAQIQIRSYSTYHTCAAIAEIARAALVRDYPTNPYLTSIEQLATKQDQHGMAIADMLATCEQILDDLLASTLETSQSNITAYEALSRAVAWLEIALARAEHGAQSVLALDVSEVQT